VPSLLRCCDCQFAMHMWSFECSSKGNMSGAIVVGDDDDNHKQTATSRRSKTRKNIYKS
jgi:hypothetical protein